MENSKRHLSVGIWGLAIAFFFTVLSGCSGGSKAPANDESSLPTVHMAYIGDRQEDLKKVETAINALLIPEMGVRLELSAVNLDHYVEEYRIGMAGGDGLDIVCVLLPDMNTLMSESLLLDMTPYLESGGEALKDSCERAGLDFARIGGGIYGVPVERLWNLRTNLFMRTDLLEKYGLSAGSACSLADCEALFSVIRENEPQLDVVCGTSGIELTDKFDYWDPLMDGLGVIELSADNTAVVNMYETESFRELVKTLYTFNKNGYIPDNISLNGDSEQEQMRAGTAFCYLAKGGNDPDLEHSNRTGYTLTSVSLDNYENRATTQSAMFCTWGVSANSDNPAIAFEVLDYIYGSVDICNLLNWGIEGIHYVKLDDNGVIDYPEGVTSENAAYHLNQTWMFPNAFQVYQWNGSSMADTQTARKSNEQLIKNETFGFLYDASNVMDEVEACKKIVDYYSSTLCYGLVDPDEILPEMNQRLYGAGLKTIMDEKQRQLDAWFEHRRDAGENK